MKEPTLPELMTLALTELNADRLPVLTAGGSFFERGELCHWVSPAFWNDDMSGEGAGVLFVTDRRFIFSIDDEVLDLPLEELLAVATTETGIALTAKDSSYRFALHHGEFVAKALDMAARASREGRDGD